jgi:hypothetical protein
VRRRVDDPHRLSGHEALAPRTSTASATPAPGVTSSSSTVLVRVTRNTYARFCRITSASRGTVKAVRSPLAGRLTSTGVPTSHRGLMRETRTSNCRERSSPTGTTVRTRPLCSTP